MIPDISNILHEFHRHLIINDLHSEHGEPALYTSTGKKQWFRTRFRNKNDSFQARQTNFDAHSMSRALCPARSCVHVREMDRDAR